MNSRVRSERLNIAHVALLCAVAATFAGCAEGGAPPEGDDVWVSTGSSSADTDGQTSTSAPSTSSSTVPLPQLSIVAEPVSDTQSAAIAQASRLPADPLAALAAVAAPAHTPLVNGGQVAALGVEVSGYSTRVKALWLIAGGDEESAESIFETAMTTLVPAGFDGEPTVASRFGVPVSFGTFHQPFGGTTSSLRTVSIVAYPIAELGMTAIEITYHSANVEPTSPGPAQVDIPDQIIAADTHNDLALVGEANPVKWEMRSGFTTFGLWLNQNGETSWTPTLDQTGSLAWAAEFEVPPSASTEPVATFETMCPTTVVTHMTYVECAAPGPVIRAEIVPDERGLVAVRVASRPDGATKEADVPRP